MWKQTLNIRSGTLNELFNKYQLKQLFCVMYLNSRCKGYKCEQNREVLYPHTEDSLVAYSIENYGAMQFFRAEDVIRDIGWEIMQQ